MDTRTEEDRARQLAQIERHRADGKTIAEALKATGIPHGTYYGWLRKKLVKKKPQVQAKKQKMTGPFALTPPAPPAGPITFIHGPYEQVQNILRGLTTLQGGAS